MIFIGFILISSIFFLFAAISGNVFHFVNLDSLAILLAADLIFSFFTFRWKQFIKGIKMMFLFRSAAHTKDREVAGHFKALMAVTIAVGGISNIQGLFSYLLSVRDGVITPAEMPLAEVLCYSGFTTVYALMLSFLLYYPIYLLNKKDEK